MQNSKKDLIKYILILITFFFVPLTSCDEDDPVTPAEEHFEAEGVILKSSGIKIAEIFQGITNDTLRAPANAIGDHMDVKFYNSAKEEIEPPNDENMSLGWEIDDKDILDIWQHEGEEGGFELHLKGLKAGSTNIEFFVLHHDHKDYRSGKFPVNVEASENSHGEPIGFVIEDEESGTILATVNNSDSSIVGSLNIKAGNTSDHMEVTFFDSQNVQFSPNVPPHSLGIELSDSSKAIITGQTVNEPWAFKIQGVSSGQTSISIKLMHDGNVGETFLPLTINVTE